MLLNEIKPVDVKAPDSDMEKHLRQVLVDLAHTFPGKFMKSSKGFKAKSPDKKHKHVELEAYVLHDKISNTVVVELVSDQSDYANELAAAIDKALTHGEHQGFDVTSYPVSLDPAKPGDPTNLECHVWEVHFQS